MEEATFLTKFATKVTLVHRRSEFRASPIMLDRARENERIEILTPYVVDRVLGEQTGKVTGVVLRHVDTGETHEIRRRVVRGDRPRSVHVAVPRVSRPRRGRVSRDEAALDGDERRGVFAADVQDHVYRQAVTAAGSGCMAALDAERFLTHEAHERASVAEATRT